MKHLKYLILLLGAIVLSACGAAAPQEAASGRDPSASTLHQMSIAATSEGWMAPETMPAGWTRVTLSNDSQGVRQAAFLRLEEGKSMDDVFAAIEAGMEGPAPWMIPHGGVSGVLPGDTGTVSLNLPAGQYIVIDPVPEADGVPGMAKGYFMPLVVEESDVTTSPPATDLSVAMADYDFDANFDSFAAGSRTIKVSNSGPQEAHELVLVRLDEGATVQDFLAALAPDAAGGPPPGRFVVGTASLSAGYDNYLEVVLEDGATYGVICFLPSTVNGGQPHFAMGMVDQFTVQ